MDSLIKTHDTFGRDLQNRFEKKKKKKKKKNVKEMRYCSAKLNVVSDVLRDGEGGLSKTITNY